MPNELDRAWYVSAQVDFRVTLNPRKPVTYYLVTYKDPAAPIETRFIYEHHGLTVLTGSDWQRIAREHREVNPL